MEYMSTKCVSQMRRYNSYILFAKETAIVPLALSNSAGNSTDYVTIFNIYLLKICAIQEQRYK